MRSISYTNFRNITIAVCFVFCGLNSAQAQTPDDKTWTTVGSDERLTKPMPAKSSSTTASCKWGICW